MSEDNLIIVGKFGAPHGVRGWIRVISFTDPETNVVEYPEWWIGKKNAWNLQKKRAFEVHSNKIIVLMEGIDQREDAALLTGQWIAVTRDALPPADEGEYYWTDLEGCRVFHEDGRDFGTVDHLIEVGSTDVMMVKNESGQRLIPFRQNEVIKHVDLVNKRITVVWDDL